MTAGRVQPPNFRIESYDVAHTFGTETVGVMVVMENGNLKKSDYRKFIIKAAGKHDDYGALSELLRRRFNHPEWPTSNLIVVDGGIGQRNASLKLLKAIKKTEIPVVSVVKDEKHKPRNLLGRADLIDKYRNQIIKINAETHRFAIAFHRKRRGVIK